MNKFLYVRKDKRFYPEINDLAYILVTEIEPKDFYKAMQRARIVGGEKFEDYYDYYIIGCMSEDELNLIKEKPEPVYKTTFSLPEEEKEKQLKIFKECQKDETSNIHN